ncbi:excalibur calcium-binding domain-containing protein [Conchiformibius kuhniae]|uniref:Excalibur calcium-binding domain-containing protein n=1 Tax=Conchiformibius kuhniae TaxID=211502 RepID=A0A8T9MVP6_9NEIS|nr:excalibur calcium-binding domain-containing protein [Conchiformibius kuhniae]
MNKWTMTVLIALGLIWYVFGRGQEGERAGDGQMHAVATRHVSSTPPPALRQPFRCDGRTHCSHMTSCEEAKFFLQNCPNVKMDGNGDGIPCERQWCH